MEAFCRAVYSALAVALAASACGLLTKGGKLASAMRYGLSLAVSAAMLLPIGLSLGHLSTEAWQQPQEPLIGTDEARRQAESVVIARAVEGVQQGICTLLEQRFGLPSETVAVRLSLNTSAPDAVRITRVEVHLCLPRDAYLVSDVQRYLENQLSAPITVTAEEDRLW